jgi:hypothetical protein
MLLEALSGVFLTPLLTRTIAIITATEEDDEYTRMIEVIEEVITAEDAGRRRSRDWEDMLLFTKY